MSKRVRSLITYATVLSSAMVATAFAPSSSSLSVNHAITFHSRSRRRMRPSFFSGRNQIILGASAAAFPEGPEDKRPSSSASSSSNSGDDNIESPQQQPRSPEFTTNFLPLESHTPSPQRRSRMEQEARNKSKFLHGDELIELRKYIRNLKTDLKMVNEKDIGGDHHSRIQDLTKALHESQNLDPEYVYANCMEIVESFDFDSEEEKMEWIKEANEARECLPQFNLQGLWVGKYGDHGYEMINVTYVGDTLIATKVTGDKNVPKGEVSFTSDLNPNAKGRDELEPIELSDIATKQWGHKHLPRFPGQGQVAAEGFVDRQWMDGQLILVGEYFSFAWIPIGHQIFFGRPSAELTLKMLKQSKMADFGATDAGSPNVVAEMRAHVQKCYEETEIMIDDDMFMDGELCFLVDDDNYYCQEGAFE